MKIVQNVFVTQMSCCPTCKSEQSCPWVGLIRGLGWVRSGMGRKFVFLVGHGSEMADVRKIHY